MQIFLNILPCSMCVHRLRASLWFDLACNLTLMLHALMMIAFLKCSFVNMQQCYIDSFSTQSRGQHFMITFDHLSWNVAVSHVLEVQYMYMYRTICWQRFGWRLNALPCKQHAFIDTDYCTVADLSCRMVWQ